MISPATYDELHGCRFGDAQPAIGGRGGAEDASFVVVLGEAGKTTTMIACAALPQALAKPETSRRITRTIHALHGHPVS